MRRMTYDEIVDVLVKERAARSKQDRSRWSRASVAEELGISQQVFYHWESRRNRASSDGLHRWAGVFGYRIISGIVSKSEVPAADELRYVLGLLGQEDRERVLRYAALLRQLSGTRDYLTLTSIVDAAENSLAKSAASGKSS